METYTDIETLINHYVAQARVSRLISRVLEEELEAQEAQAA